MNFSSALNEISKEFKISLITNKIANIFINKLIDESNYYFICLEERDNNLILTDCGKTFELLEDKDLLKRIPHVILKILLFSMKSLLVLRFYHIWRKR